MSSKTNSIVEVNGSRYDAITGQLLSPRKILPGKKVIDGFTLGTHHKNQSATKATLAERKAAKAQSLHQRTQKSVTLMRKAVKKPVGVVSEMTTGSARRVQNHKVSFVREMRAKTVPKHSKVERFGVLPQSKTAATQDAKPVKFTAKATYRNSAAATSTMPSMVTSATTHKKLEQMLDEALIRADSHRHRPKNRRFTKFRGPFAKIPRWINFTILIFIAAIIAFWLIWQNLPTVAMHVAAARAHVNASLPHYTPSGFSLASPISYKDGSVTMQYKNEAGAQAYSLIQKASNWDSASLVNNLIPASQATQTSMVDGTTVYIYGNSGNAAWVNHGVLYNLQNQAGLSSEQILKIVQGL